MWGLGYAALINPSVKRPIPFDSMKTVQEGGTTEGVERFSNWSSPTTINTLQVQPERPKTDEFLFLKENIKIKVTGL